MAELDGGNDEFAGGKVVIDNTAQEDEFSGGNVVVDNTSSKKKAVSQPIIEPVNEFSKDILPNSPVSASVTHSTTEAEASKRIKGDLDADLNTKVMQIDGSKVTVQSLLDKGWTKEKISKNYNIPIIGGGEPKKREVSPSLIETTKKQFSTNPLFDIKNPNHEKNKEAYINNLADSGYDVTSLMQVAADVTKGKKLIEENTPISEKVPEYLKGLKGITPQANRETEYNKGTGYLLINDPDKAIKAFEKSVELNKAPVISQQQIMQGDNIKTQHKAAENPANAYYGIGLAYLDKKDDTQAQNAFIQGMEKDPANPENKLGLASIFEKQGNKQEAQKLVSQAADNYAQEATALQIQADQEADEKKNQRARDLMSMADKLQAYASGDPNHELGTLGMLTPQGFVMGMAQGVTHGLGTIKTGVENYIKGDKVKGGLGMLTGSAQTVFAAQPFVQTFNTFISPIKDLEQKYPDNQPLSAVSKLIDYPFALTTSIGRDFFNYKADEGSKVALTMELADIVIMMGGGAIVHAKVNNAKSYANYVKDVAERAKNGEDISNDIEQLKKFNETVAKINKGEIKIAAKKLGAKEVVKAIEKSEPMPSEEVKKLQDELDELSAAEVNDISAPIIEAKKKEIQEAIEKQKEKEHQEAIKDAVKKTEEQELEEKIKGLEQSIKDNKGNEDVVKVLQAELDKLKPKENAGVKQSDEVVSETRETEDAPVTPKENDTVELLPILDGYPNRKMVFKDGEWQASAGGKETSKVSDAVQKAAQEAFEKGNKPDTINAKEQVEGHKQNDGSTFMSGKDMGGTPNEAVSIFPERTKINKGNNVSEQDIVDFKEKNKDLLEGNEDVLGVGTWYDKKTDQTYIDVTSIIPKEHAKEAHELGRDYNQKETVSLEDFKSTDTGGDGTIKEGWKKEKDRIAEIRQAQKGEYIKNKEQPKVEAPKKEKPLSPKEAQLKEIEEKRKADAEKAIESTKKALKATGIDLIADKEAYDKAVRDKKGQEGGDGIFISEDGKIYLNPEKFKDADGRVIVFHEGTHPIMNIIRNTNRKLYDSIVKGLKKAAETNDGVKDVKAWVEREYEKDGEVVIEDEFITETIARIADGTLKLEEIPPTLKQQIIDFVNTAAKMLGFEEVLSDTDPVAFKKLAEQVANALKEGKDVSEIVGEKNIKEYEFKDGEVIDGNPSLTGINDPAAEHGDVVATGLVPKNLGDRPAQESRGDRKKVEGLLEYGYLSDIAGKPLTATMSDRATVGDVSYKDGKPYPKQGGALYPLLMKALGLDRVWASMKRNKMQSLLNNLKTDKDGFSYVGIMIMAEESHMSNIDAFNFAFEAIEHETKSANRLTKQEIIDAVKQAYNRKVKGKEIHRHVGRPAINQGMTLNEIKTAVLNNLGHGAAAFELRRGFLDSLLGNATKKDGRLKSTPNYVSMAKLIAEPLVEGAKHGDIVAYVKVKKADLYVEETKEGEVGHHKSYPWSLKSKSPIEYVFLKKPVSVSKVFPEFINKKRNKISFEQAKEAERKYQLKNKGFIDEEQVERVATARHARNVMMSAPSEAVPQQSKGNRGDYAKNTYLEPHLTKDEKGDYVFFHVSGADKKALEKGIDSRKQNSTRTSKEEKGLQYGVASFYTKPSDGEGMVGGEKYQVTVAPEKVYPMDTDPNGYKEKAEQKVKEGTPFRRENIKKQMAEMARKDGYEMAVAEWNYDRSGKGDGKLALRADALVPLKAEDLKETSPATDKQIPHPDQQEILNQEKINDLAQDIYDYKSKKEEYDDAYSIAQDIITYGEKPSAEDFKTMTDGAPKKLQEKIKEAKSAAQFSKGNRNKNVDDYHDDYVKVAKFGLEEDPNYSIDDLAQDTGFKKEDLQGVWDEATGKEDVKETLIGGEKKKKVVGRAHEGEFTHDEVKKKLEEIGLNRNVKTVEEAIGLADQIIKDLGLDEAIAAVERGDVNQSEGAIIMGRAIDMAHEAYKEAKTDKNKDIAAQIEADLLDKLDSMNVSAGRFTGVMSKVYQMSPLGYKKYARKKLTNANEATLEKIQPQLDALKNQVEASQKEAADLLETNIELQAKIDELRGKKSKTVLSPEEQGRKAELKSKVFGRFNDITTFARLLADKESMEYVGLVFKEAKGDFKQFAKEVVNTLGKKLKEHLPELWRELGGKEHEIEYEPQTALINRLKDKMKGQNEALQKRAIENLGKANKGLWGKYKEGAAKTIESKIEKELSGGKPKNKAILQEFTGGLVKNILGLLPKEEHANAERKPAIEIIVDAFKNKEKYKEVLEKAKADLEEKYNPNEKGLKEDEVASRQETLIKLDEVFGELFDKPFSDKIVEQSAKEGLNEMFGDDTNKKLVELAKEYFKEGEKVKGALVDYLVDKTGLNEEMVEPYAKTLEEVYDKILNKKVAGLIETTFPLPRLIDRAKAKKEHERIVQAINIGLKTGQRKDGTPFDFTKEFYNRFGLIDVNEAGLNAKLNEFADKIYESRNDDNPLYKDIATIELLDWIANRQNESRLREGIIEQLYANMLYGEDTHLRNTEYNAQVVIGAMIRQVVQQPQYAKPLLNAFAKSWEQGVVEMKNVIMTGMPKSGSDVKARQFGERAKDINKFLNAWTKYVNKPSRLLQGMDALGNFPLRKSRVAFLLIDELKKSNPSLSTKFITQEVNKRLYGTDVQQVEWRKTAEAQTQKYYGVDQPLFVDGKRNPLYSASKYNEMYRNNKRSFFNLQDANLKDVDIFKEAKDFSDTNFLMSKPKGYFGVGAHLVNEFGTMIPFGKVLTTPFVNVPFNIAANIFEYSPLGYLTTMAGKEGYGVNPQQAKRYGIETDYSERRGKELLYKATVGALAMITIKALTKVMYDDDEEGERPVLIVTADGTGNYMENKKLEKLKGSEKFEEYSVDFMGHKMSYKYSPYAAWFLYSGITMDAERYGDKGLIETPDNVEKMAKAWAGFFVYMKDQSSISGLADLLNLGERSGFKKEKTKDKVFGTAEKFAAKTLRTFVTPNFIPQTYRHYKGFFDLDESSGDGFLNTLAKDIPFADQFVDKRYDHFGKPIDSKWKIAGLYNEPQPDDPMYQLTRDKKYINKLHYFRQSKIELDNQSYPLSKEQVNSIDKLRSRYAGETFDKMQEGLKQLSPSDFSKLANKIFNEAQKRAISETGVSEEFKMDEVDRKIAKIQLDLDLMKLLKPEPVKAPTEQQLKKSEIGEEKEKVRRLKDLDKQLKKMSSPQMNKIPAGTLGEQLYKISTK